MIKFTLKTDDGAIHEGTGANYGYAAQSLIQNLLDCYEQVMPEVFEGLHKTSNAHAIGRDDLQRYFHFDMSCPEEQFELFLIEY